MQFNLKNRAYVRRLNSLIDNGTLSLEPRPCLCGETRTERLVSYGRYGEIHPVGICCSCGLVYASPYFDTKSLIWFYGSREYRLMYEGDNIEDLAKERLALGWGTEILDLVSKAKGPGASVVEIGCGGGWNLMTFKRAGYDVCGYEYTPALVTAGQAAGLDIRAGSAQDAEGEYDVVIVNQVLEHVPDFHGFIGHIKRLMKPNGVLYVAVPDIEVYGPGQFQNAHCYYFSPRTLIHYMAQEGVFTDGLFPFLVSVRGLFRKSAGPIPSLANEYETIKAKIAPRRWWATFMTTLHHYLIFLP